MCQVTYRVYSVEAVANYIMNWFNARSESVTNLKMQKLVYFAQGFVLAELRHPLFREKLEAWAYGPVVRELYLKLNKYQSAPITAPLDCDDFIEKDSREGQQIERMLRMLGHLTATQLVKLSHQKNTPWDATMEQDGKFSVIPLWRILDYFSDALKPAES